MPPGTPSTGEAFGHQFAFADGETPNSDWSDEALDAEASTEAPPEPAPAAPPPQQQQEGQPEPPPAEGGQEPEAVTETEAQAVTETEAQPGETPEETAERLYADRYRTVEDLESGYKNIQALQKRTQDQRQATELRNQQLEAALQQLVPYLEAQQRGEAPAQEVLDPTQLTAQQLQQMIDQQVSQRVTQATQQASQQTRQEVVQRDMRQAVESFMATHPDVAPGTPLDLAIGEVLEELQTDREGKRNFDQFPVTPTNLDVAYELARQPEIRNMVQQLDLVPNNETLAIAKEAAGNPALAEVLLAQPVLVDTDHGLAYARKQAALPGMYSEAAQKVAAPSPEVARRAAYVETGGTGAPVTQAPGATPQDEMDEAIAEWNKGRDNIFGLAVD